MVNTRTKTDEIAHSRAVIANACDMLAQYIEFFNSDEADDEESESLECRLETIRPLYEKVEQAFNIVTATSENEQEKAAVKQMVFTFNNDFATCVGKITKELKKARAAEASPQSQGQQRETKSNFKTPKIELPEFSGSIEEWTHFRDMFVSLVHNNTTLNDIEKFHFLKNAIKLSAGASNVVNNFQFSATNYQDAWTAVCNRYDEKRKIVKHYVKKLFDLKQMSSGTSTEIRKLIDTVSSTLSSLKHQGFELHKSNEFGNLLITHVVMQCLDAETLKQWRKDMTEDFSTWQELYDFLNGLQKSLDDQPFQIKPLQRQSDYKAGKSKALFTNHRAVSSNSSADKCVLCSETHRLHQCPKFANMSIARRYTVVKEKRLCHNCLGQSHQAKACLSAKRCRTCGDPHHTLIHFEQAAKPQHAHQANQQPGLSTAAQPFHPVVLNKQPTGEARVSMATNSKHSFTMLSTVSVHVTDADGNFHLGRALLDSGSNTCFMTTAFAKQLGLEIKETMMSVTSFGERTVLLKNQTVVEI